MQTTGERDDWDDSGSWLVASARGRERSCTAVALLSSCVRDLGWVRITGRRPYGEDTGVLGVAVRPGSAVTVEEIGES
jgi:hypothetical protein